MNEFNDYRCFETIEHAKNTFTARIYLDRKPEQKLALVDYDSFMKFYLGYIDTYESGSLLKMTRKDSVSINVTFGGETYYFLQDQIDVTYDEIKRAPCVNGASIRLLVRQTISDEEIYFRVQDHANKIDLLASAEFFNVEKFAKSLFDFRNGKIDTVLFHYWPRSILITRLDDAVIKVTFTEEIKSITRVSEFLLRRPRIIIVGI